MNIIYRSFVYDFLYAMADYYISKYNFCNLHLKDGKIWCAANSHACCSHCKLVGPSGCTVRNLRCKLHICGYGDLRRHKGAKYIRITKQFDMADKIMWKLFIHQAWQPKRIVLKQCKQYYKDN